MSFLSEMPFNGWIMLTRLKTVLTIGLFLNVTVFDSMTRFAGCCGDDDLVAAFAAGVVVRLSKRLSARRTGLPVPLRTSVNLYTWKQFEETQLRPKLFRQNLILKF
jgi:hypothetical protein